MIGVNNIQVYIKDAYMEIDQQYKYVKIQNK